MDAFQRDVNCCIQQFCTDYEMISKEFSKHGLPIRFLNKGTGILWLFADGYQLLINQ